MASRSSRHPRARHLAEIVAASALIAAVAACGSTPAPPAAPAGKTVDAATAGSIGGKVTFTGKRPAPDRIKMGSDPACMQMAGPSPQSDAVVIAANGALANSFVYIKSGLDPAYTFPAATSTVPLEQKGCRYAPRVLGIRVGQTMEIINADPTMHNVHAMPTMNQEFNQSQIAQGSRMTHVFTQPEVMVHFKCNVHNWMTAYVGVVTHPYFAVTGADGTFTLSGVPPGTYTVEAWHEKFGTRSATVTVPASGAEHVEFSFSPAS